MSARHADDFPHCRRQPEGKPGCNVNYAVSDITRVGRHGVDCVRAQRDRDVGGAAKVLHGGPAARRVGAGQARRGVDELGEAEAFAVEQGAQGGDAPRRVVGVEGVAVPGDELDRREAKARDATQCLLIRRLPLERPDRRAEPHSLYSFRPLVPEDRGHLDEVAERVAHGEARPVRDLRLLADRHTGRGEATPQRLHVVDLEAEMLGWVAGAALIPEQMQFIVAQTVPHQVEVGERRGDRDFLKPQDIPVETTRLVGAAARPRHADVLKPLYPHRVAHVSLPLPLHDSGGRQRHAG